MPTAYIDEMTRTWMKAQGWEVNSTDYDVEKEVYSWRHEVQEGPSPTLRISQKVLEDYRRSRWPTCWTGSTWRQPYRRGRTAGMSWGERPRVTLFSQKLPHRREHFDVIAADFERGQHRDGDEGARQSPDPQPER
jgi:hypothetical protein